MKVKYCVEYTIEQEDVYGWKNLLDGTPAVDRKSISEWFDTEIEAERRIDFLMLRADVTKLSFIKKIILKG